MADANPFRFSTKYQDDETDLIYYGHRYYSAGPGRWLSRDPIVEWGGSNLYALVQNDPIVFADRLGLETIQATDEIIVRSGYRVRRVTGPPKCFCSKTILGTIQVMYAYAKATTTESLVENHQDVLQALQDRLASIPGLNLARAQSANFLGAGFIVDFTPNSNAAKCCKRIYWKQWILHDQWRWPWWRSVLEYDYTGGHSGADLAGDNVNQMGLNRDWRRSFVLELYCDKSVIFVIPWSYHVAYQAGWPDHATVLLDAAF